MKLEECNLNEFSILFHLLTKQNFRPINTGELIIGSTYEEICQVLKYEGKTRKYRWNELMNNFSTTFSPFGLQIKQNPFNDYWYLTQDQKIQNLFTSFPVLNNLRLAATFSTIISLCIIHSGSTNIEQIRKIRKKKDILQDLNELLNINLIKMEGNKVKIHQNIGYFIDLEKFQNLMESESYSLMKQQNEDFH